MKYFEIVLTIIIYVVISIALSILNDTFDFLNIILGTPNSITHLVFNIFWWVIMPIVFFVWFVHLVFRNNSHKVKK